MGPVTIVVTRHYPPVALVGPSAGAECIMMWNDVAADYRQSVRATADRVKVLCEALFDAGFGPISTVDAFPSSRLFRGRTRREIEGVVNALNVIDPGRIVIDESHPLAGKIHSALADAEWSVGFASQQPIDLAAFSHSDAVTRRDLVPIQNCLVGDSLDELWIDLGGSE